MLFKSFLEVIGISGVKLVIFLTQQYIRIMHKICNGDTPLPILQIPHSVFQDIIAQMIVFLQWFNELM